MPGRQGELVELKASALDCARAPDGAKKIAVIFDPALHSPAESFIVSVCER